MLHALTPFCSLVHPQHTLHSVQNARPHPRAGGTWGGRSKRWEAIRRAVLNWYVSFPAGDLVILGGSLASSWLQGRSTWGSKGFFPSSCVRELCLSVRSRQLSQSTLLEVPPYSLGQARALMDLSAQLEEELDFREGDVINIVGVPEPGWFEGELRGHRGIFPEGFVELLTPLRAPGTSVDPEPTGTCDTNGTVEMAPREEEEPGNTYGVALYQFQALESKELDFDVGDRIRIIGILEDGWLEGELRGKTGIFPHRFVRLEASEPCREKVDAGDPQDGDNCGVTIHQDLESTCSEALPLSGKDGGEEEDGLAAHHDPYTILSHTAEETEDHPGTDLKQCQAFPSAGHQGEHPKGTPDSLPFDCTKMVNGLLPSVQLPSQWGNRPGQAGELEPGGTISASPGSSETHTQEHDGDSPAVPPQTPHSPTDSCRSQVISPTSWAVSKPQESQSSTQDLDGLANSQQEKAKPCSSSLGGAQVALDTWAGSWGECCVLAAQGDGCTDLDSKLTEQLAQFEKSLSSTSTEQDKVSRHFSILDYSSEKDIVRGSPECATHARQPERRKALRPPPPRPSSLATTSVHTLGGQRSKGRSLSFSVKPSRPAPQPPSSNQRKNVAPAQLQSNTQEQRVQEGRMDLTRAGSASPRSILLTRIGEVERDLEAYGKTRAELSLMLEEQQDEMVRVETLENLDFCDSNIESLSIELQELRGKSAASWSGRASGGQLAPAHTGTVGASLLFPSYISDFGHFIRVCAVQIVVILPQRTTVSFSGHPSALAFPTPFSFQLSHLLFQPQHTSRALMVHSLWVLALKQKHSCCRFTFPASSSLSCRRVSSSFRVALLAVLQLRIELMSVS